MLRREYILILLGAAIMLLGGALYVQFFSGEPAWVEWVLGPVTAFAGICIVIAGVTMRCYSRDSAAAPGEDAATSARL